MICHDVLLINLPGNASPQLSGASQDEIQLLHAGQESGFAKLVNKDSDTIAFELNGKREEYQLLKVLEFSSDRKMMSVIVKSFNTNKVLVFTKGADEKLISLASNQASQHS
jgi:phospholipid-translocating ATPase